MNENNYLYVSAGSTPPAFANSVSWFLALHQADYKVTDIFFIPSKENTKYGVKGTRDNIPKAIDLAKQSLSMMNPQLLDEVTFHEQPPFSMPEEDLLEATRVTVKNVREAAAGAGTIIFDMTAGRKTMGAAITLSANILKFKYTMNVFITYYWLIHWNKENLRKKAHELGRDDIASKVFNLDHLDEIIKSLE
ncbi:hypothetical protein GF325_06435 [Candidatus Bathyarchaeota archaeon]|nr:hypothetical protein [Candidatus Bathyarchaeota archaeon]